MALTRFMMDQIHGANPPIFSKERAEWEWINPKDEGDDND